MNKRLDIVDIASNTVEALCLALEEALCIGKCLTGKRLRLLQHPQIGHQRVPIGIHSTKHACLDTLGAPLGYSHHRRVALLFRPRRTSK